MVFYNEFDKKAAAWLRELIAAGLIADGVVDERSITDVQPRDLKGFTQCHFFAGVGGWPRALRLAGWPDDRPVWTGSCPCQPFSSAGKGLGYADPRHLWPAFRRLINRCRPEQIFGEQVASKAGRDWLSGVRANSETMGYAFWAADICSASVGAPNIRQRLYWMAYSCGPRSRGHGGTIFGEEKEGDRKGVEPRGFADQPITGGAAGPAERLGQSDSAGSQPGRQATEAYRYGSSIEPNGGPSRLDNATGTRCRGPEQGPEADPRDKARLRLLSEGCGLDGPSRVAVSHGRDAGVEELQRSGEHRQQPQDGGVGRLEYSAGDGRLERGAESSGRTIVGGRSSGGVGDSTIQRREGGVSELSQPGETEGRLSTGPGHPSGVAYASWAEGARLRALEHVLPGAAGFWDDYDLIPCTDGKVRRVESGTLPLVNGLPRGVVPSGTPSEQEAQNSGEARVMRLRGYGNAINPVLAAEFILACEEGWQSCS